MRTRKRPSGLIVQRSAFFQTARFSRNPLPALTETSEMPSNPQPRSSVEGSLDRGTDEIQPVRHRGVQVPCDPARGSVASAHRRLSRRLKQGGHQPVMKRLIADARGALMLEYVVILLLVAGGAGAAIVMIGIAMAKYFAAQQAWLLIPFP